MNVSHISSFCCSHSRTLSLTVSLKGSSASCDLSPLTLPPRLKHILSSTSHYNKLERDHLKWQEEMEIIKIKDRGLSSSCVAMWAKEEVETKDRVKDNVQVEGQGSIFVLRPFNLRELGRDHLRGLLGNRDRKTLPLFSFPSFHLNHFMRE